MQTYRQWRCYTCPEHTDKFVVIAIGNRWYQPVQPAEAGKSLIVSRTSRNFAMLKLAAGAGYLALGRKNLESLPQSMQYLLVPRGSIWGRLIDDLWTTGADESRFSCFGIFRGWLKNLSCNAKLGSSFDTVRRVSAKNIIGRRAFRELNSAEQCE